MPYRVYNTTSTERCLFLSITYYLRQQDCEKRWSTERQSAVPKVMVVMYLMYVTTLGETTSLIYVFPLKVLKKNLLSKVTRNELSCLLFSLCVIFVVI